MLSYTKVKMNLRAGLRGTNDSSGPGLLPMPGLFDAQR
jgi:hypothetical protein